MNASLRLVCLGSVMAAVLWLAPRSAAADICATDIDCPEPQCGGQVCWMGRMCRPATDPNVFGWCNHDEQCKCMGLGARCDPQLSWCTMIVPPDGGAAAGTGGSGAAAGTRGSGADAAVDGGSKSEGCSVAGGAASGRGLGGLAIALLIAATRRARPVECLKTPRR